MEHHKMITKRFYLLLVLLVLALPVHLQAADQRVTLSITLTNLPVTSNTLVFTAPASKTITWTNVASSANVITGATIAASATNLFRNLAAYAIGAPRLIVSSMTNATNFTIVGEVNQNIAVTPTGTGAGNWCSLVLATQTVTTLTTVRVPIASEPTAAARTNVASLLAQGITDYSTNAIGSNSTALLHALQLNTNAQQVLGPKSFDKLNGGTNIGTLYGGWTSGATNINPINTNTINYGNALRSEGIGGNSLQLGSNALAKALRTIAIGADAFATNSDAIAIGNGAISTNTDSIALGRASRASTSTAMALGLSATATGEAANALGSEAVATGYADLATGKEATASGGSSSAYGAGSAATATNSTAVGVSAVTAGPGSTAIGKGATTSATHTNSVAVGAGSATTTDGQIMLGSADVFLAQTYARLQVGSHTNSLFTGTNRNDGDMSITPVAVSTFANGNNVAVAGTNLWIKASGPSGAYAICGITGGRSGRDLEILNDVQQVLTIANESGVDPTAANRIITPGYADVTIATNGWAYLRYDATVSRWRLRMKYP